MNVLYLSNYFHSIDKGESIYTDLAKELSNSGHRIFVVVADQDLKSGFEIANTRGFSEYRIRVPKYYNTSFLKKGFALLMRPFYLKKHIRRILKKNNFDIFLYESPPISNASIVKWIKRKKRLISYLMLKDIFPQNAVDLGIIKHNSILHLYFKRLERKLYQWSDIIGCMSKANIEYLGKNSNINANKLKYFPNTQSIYNNFNTGNNSKIREKYGIPSNATIFLFGGNMGKPQYMDLLGKAIMRFKEDPKIFFLFIGRGAERGVVGTAISKSKCSNAIILEELSRSEYESVLKEADVGLITLNPKFTIPNFPSKSLSYMEYGIPILAATDNSTDFKNMIHDSKCGVWVPSNDDERFFEEIHNLSLSDELCSMGEKGKKYFLDNFTVDKSVSYFEKHILDFKQKSSK